MYAGCVRVRVLVCVCGVREREGGRGKKGERVLYNPERESTSSVEWRVGRAAPVVGGGVYTHTRTKKYCTLALISARWVFMGREKEARCWGQGV